MHRILVDDKSIADGWVQEPALVYSNQDLDSMVAFSQNSDAHIRAIALADLIKARARSSGSPDHHDVCTWLISALYMGLMMPQIVQRLLLSLKDNDNAVIEAIYSDPIHLLQIAAPTTLLDAIVEALKSPDLSRHQLRLHLNFVNGPLIEEHLDQAHAVFCEVLFPYLFFSKSRQKTAAIVWEGISNSKLNDYAYLRGCSDIFNSFQSPLSTSDLPQLNTVLIDKIAGKLLAFYLYLSRSPDPHSSKYNGV